MKKNIGVWLDKEKAQIITLENKKITLKTVASAIENYNIGGGSGTKFKGGPQDVVQDSRYLEREKHQFKAYFKAIVLQLKNADAIVILGPAETNQKFKKELEENYKDINMVVMAVKKSDSMSDNQLKAWVKNFFKN